MNATDNSSSPTAMRRAKLTWSRVLTQFARYIQKGQPLFLHYSIDLCTIPRNQKEQNPNHDIWCIMVYHVWTIVYEVSSCMGLGRPWRCLTCIQMFQIHTVIVLVPVCFGCCSSNTKFYICRSKKDLAPKKSGMMWKMRVLTPECKSFPNIFRPTQ